MSATTTTTTTITTTTTTTNPVDTDASAPKLSSSSSGSSSSGSSSSSSGGFQFSMSVLDVYYFNLNKVLNIFSKNGKLEPSDLGSLPEDGSVAHINPLFETRWREEIDAYKDPKDRSLFRVLIKTVGSWNLGIVVILQALVVALSFSVPQLTSAISNHQTGITPLSTPVYHLLIALMFICPFFGAICNTRCLMNLSYLQSKFGNALISKIYNKCLSMAPSTKHSQGQITVMYTTDINNVKTFPSMILTAVFAPAQAAIALALIYQQVGVAMFVALACILLITPITSLLTIFMNKAISERRQHQGERVKLTNDVLNGIKIAKYYSWESAFEDAICIIREKEIFWNRRVMLSFSFISLVSNGLPIAQPILVFYTYIKLGYSLTFAKAFVTIMLFNILKAPVTQLTGMANQYLTSMNSVGRILDFLNAPDNIDYVVVDQEIDGGRTALKFENASLGWMTAAEAKELEEKERKEREEREKRAAAAAQKSSNNDKNNNSTTEKDAKTYNSVATSEPEKPSLPVLKDASREVNRHVETLTDLSFQVNKGDLVVITGHVGSGKTSILKAILNGLKLKSGKISMSGSVAYHAQQPWILNATVKDNILFGRAEDKELFDKVLDLSCLQADLLSFTNGLDTEIGEKGVTLSGGQKARVSFARALYRDTDIVILDDPLSAVDSAVGRKMYSEGIVKYLCGRGKTVILVTHQVHLLVDCKNIIVIDEGKIIAQGDYHAVSSHIAPPEDAAEQEQEVVSSSDIGLVVQVSTATAISGASSNNSASTPISPSSPSPAGLAKQVSIKKNSMSEKLDKADPESKKEVKVNDKEKGKLVKDEVKNTGIVPFSVYKFYMVHGSPFFLISSLLMIVAFFVATTISQFWLAAWGQREANNFVATGKALSVREGMYYLQGYAIILMIGVGLDYFKVIFGIFHTVKVNKSFHLELLHVVLRAPSYWFDVTPLGRIITRFTSDMEMSNFVHYLMWYSFVSFCGVMSAVVTISITTKGAALLLLVPLAVMYYFLYLKFSGVTTDLSRIQSLSQSPININFMQTLSGIDTIRSYKVSDTFFSKIVKGADSLAVAFLTSAQTFQWLSVRLDTFGALLSFAMTLLTALTLKEDFIPPAQLALAMVFIIQLPSMMTSMISQLSSLGTMMSNVQRIKEYIDNVPDEDEYLSGIKHVDRSLRVANAIGSSSSEGGEGGDVELIKVKSVVKPPPEWPSEGIIESRELKLGYFGGPDILNGVNFQSRAKEKIGVIGRTGSGKSTLVTALFHIELVRHGEIFIDGVDIGTVDVHHLRTKLCIIPQDPVMFVGTVRYNLDPFNLFSDQDIWAVLEKTRMKHDIEHLPNKLMETVAEGGSNFSVGQRQLICFARALLKKPKILVLDEATASVDNETDAHVQRMIRDLFKDCTVLTIAHRLNTILDSDRIMVLGQGKVIEFDSPEALLKNPDSHFFKMYSDFKKEHESNH